MGHTEFLAPAYKAVHMNKLLPEPCAPAIALLGDIGYPFEKGYEQVISYCAVHWDHVFVLLGNHEYYQGARHRTMSCIEARVEHLCAQHSNVTCATHTCRIDYEGVCFLLTTLWSDLGSTALERNVVAAEINDYKNIWCNASNGDVRPRRLVANDVQMRHESERDWLHHEIKRNEGAELQTVVLTHHAPSLHFASGLCSRAYGTSLEHLMLPHVCAWLFGHIHDSVAKRLCTEGGTLCAANCRGYPSKLCMDRVADAAYDPGLVLEVGAAGARLVGRSRLETFEPE